LPSYDVHSFCLLIYIAYMARSCKIKYIKCFLYVELLCIFC